MICCSFFFKRSFLRDLIEANHIFLLLLEYHTKKNGVLSVMSRKKKSKKSKKSNKKNKNSKKVKTKETKEEKEKRLHDEKEYKKRVENQDPKLKEKIWQSQFSKVASLFQNEIELKCEEDNLMPFDFAVTNDQEFDAQKDLVIEKIQNL
jgi:hypothetical protein